MHSMVHIESSIQILKKKSFNWTKDTLFIADSAMGWTVMRLFSLLQAHFQEEVSGCHLWTHLIEALLTEVKKNRGQKDIKHKGEEEKIEFMRVFCNFTV